MKNNENCITWYRKKGKIFPKISYKGLRIETCFLKDENLKQKGGR